MKPVPSKYSCDLFKKKVIFPEDQLHTTLHNAKLDKISMQENFLLNKIPQVGVDSLKALKLLGGKRKTSSDCIMKTKCIYKAPYIVQTILEVIFSGKWQKLADIKKMFQIFIILLKFYLSSLNFYLTFSHNVKI